MTTLPVLVVAVTLATASQDPVPDWQLWFGASSGMGGRKGLYVDSAGRNVAYPPSRSRNNALDLRRGTPTAFCESSPLSEHQIRTFAFRIASIPNDVLKNGGLSVGSTCMDELKYGVTLRVQQREYHFGYSEPLNCRDGGQVPTWLTSLVNALRTRYRKLEDCSVTTTDAEGAP
jgi:hypothetical protein